jgi:hypothetical protein
MRFIDRVCIVCGVEFQAEAYNVRKGWGKCCSVACRRKHTAASKRANGNPRVLRKLRPGEPIPDGTPTRYITASGYIKLRWRTGKQYQVEEYEHRIVTGRPAPKLQVHHVNGNKSDNRPENLMVVTPLEHTRLHKAAPKHVRVQG